MNAGYFFQHLAPVIDETLQLLDWIQIFHSTNREPKLNYFAPPAAERITGSALSDKPIDFVETSSRTSLRLKRQLRPMRLPGITPFSASLYTVLRCILSSAATSEDVRISVLSVLDSPPNHDTTESFRSSSDISAPGRPPRSQLM